MIRYLLFARILGIVVLSFTASFLMLKGFLFIPVLFGFGLFYERCLGGFAESIV